MSFQGNIITTVYTLLQESFLHNLSGILAVRWPAARWLKHSYLWQFKHPCLSDFGNNNIYVNFTSKCYEILQANVITCMCIHLQLPATGKLIALCKEKWLWFPAYFHKLHTFLFFRYLRHFLFLKLSLLIKAHLLIIFQELMLCKYISV